MTNPKSRILAAVAGALSLGAAATWAVEPTQQDRIQALETTVAQLQAERAQNTKDLAATIDNVLRDAEQRSQLMAMNGDSGAGYGDNGFFIRSGGFELRPGAGFQFRNVTDYRTNTSGGKDDEIDNGFEIRRMKLMLNGTMFTKDLVYSINWETDDNSGGMFLEDAWVKYTFADGWAFRAGQFKDPVSHEALIDDFHGIAVERSLLDAELGGGFLDRTQGVTLIYGGHDANNPLNAEAGLTDGLNQDNTDFTKHALDFGVVGRVEYKAMGDWAAYADSTAMGNKKDSLLVFGLGGDWSQSGNGDVLTGALDGQFETPTGLSIFGEVLARKADKDITPSGKDITDWGFLLQAGYMLNTQWEIFGRWDMTLFDERIASAGDSKNFNEITLGVNYYLGQNGSAGHRAKVTIDLTYLPDGSPAPNTGLGFTGDSNGDAEWVLRGQFQLLI